MRYYWVLKRGICVSDVFPRLVTESAPRQCQSISRNVHLSVFLAVLLPGSWDQVEWRPLVEQRIVEIVKQRNHFLDSL